MPSLVKYTKSDSDSKFYEPLDDGLIDVVNDMSWTLSPISSRKDVPYVELTEYQQTTGQLLAALVYYGRVLGNVIENGLGTIIEPDDPEEVYKYKYFAQPTGFSYRLPYFNPQKISRGNTFGADESPFAGIGAGIAVANTMLPGAVNFENPQSWTGSAMETISVNFDLFNTTNLTDVNKNRRFCHLFSYQNTASRRNFAIVDPPAIYSLFIPDVVQFPACYVSDLKITNLGNTRILKLGGKDRTVPEAYRISITFTSLLMPTRNLMRSLEKGRKVEAISDVRPSIDVLKAIDAYQNGTATFEQRKTFAEFLAKFGNTQAAQDLEF